MHDRLLQVAKKLEDNETAIEALKAKTAEIESNLLSLKIKNKVSKMMPSLVNKDKLIQMHADIIYELDGEKLEDMLHRALTFFQTGILSEVE
jgi:hypothetical protein